MSEPSPCPEWASDLTAFVDGALAPRAREEAARHVATCSGCRSEVAELRRIREVFVAPAASHVPENLEQRLVAIADGQHDRQLWLASEHAGALPSPRERRRRAVVLMAGITLMVLGAVTGMAWSVAPDTAVVDDVADQARAELRIAQSDSVTEAESTALTVAYSKGALPATSPMPADAASGLAEASLAVPESAVTSLLAGVSKAQQPFAATRTSCLLLGGGLRCAPVLVERNADGEIQVSVLDKDGAVIVAGVAVEQIDLNLLHPGDSYRLRGWSQLDGTDMLVVEAVRPTGTLRTRWWINPWIGLVGGVSAFKADGGLVAISRLSSFTQTPPRTVTSTATSMSRAEFTVKSSGPACTGDFVCPEELMGLRLGQLSADSATHPQFVHSVYREDGHLISVIQQRGQLATQMRTGIFSNDDAEEPLVVSWQSGDVVISVTGTSDLLTQQAAEQLPHQPVHSKAWQRLRAGLQHILSGGD